MENYWVAGKYAKKLLKKPLGILMDTKQMIDFTKNVKGRIISVGDISTYTLISNGIFPNLAIYDKRCMRMDTNKNIVYTIENFCSDKYFIKNIPGTISKDAYELIYNILQNKQNNSRSCIEVEGEEDLLALPVIINADISDMIVYGQPNEGVVVVIPSQEKKDFAKKILAMKN